MGCDAADTWVLVAGASTRFGGMLHVRTAHTPVVGDLNGDGTDDIFWVGLDGASTDMWHSYGDGAFEQTAYEL